QAAAKAAAAAAVADGGPVICILFFSASFSVLTEALPLSWLLRVPYLATSLLSEELSVDQSSSCPQQQHVFGLNCTPGTPPVRYLRCLYLLAFQPSIWPSLMTSASEVLGFLPIADHLRFQECWDACMAFLASSPWSCDEEAAIRATLFSLTMKPSP
ncbi:hypothetical protein GOP47_0005590, partial [Adiantum capillus-veneris]